MRWSQFQIEGAVSDPCRMLEHPTIGGDKGGAVHQMRRGPVNRRMGRRPVGGNLASPGEPCAILRRRIVEKPFQPHHPPRPADQAAMQPDRHHSGPPRLTFGIQRIKRIFQIAEEMIAGVEALWRGEAHVIGVERIGDHQLVAPAHLDPIGQIIVIGIGNPVKAARLGHQPHGIGRTAPGVPAARGGTGNFGMQPDRLGNRRPLLRLGHILVVHPFQPMRRQFPPGVDHRHGLIRIARQSGGDAKDRQRYPHPGEQPVQPPEPGPRAVVVDRFHVPVALARPRGGPDNL